MREFQDKRSGTSSRVGPADTGPVPGKRTLTEGLPAAGTTQRKADPAPAMPAAPRAKLQDLFGRVQRKVAGAEPDAAAIHASAERGIATSASPLPHLDRVQPLFGRHDVSGIQAHTGPRAASSALAMGAEAFAVGNHVAFAGEASLHTAAHEAAHVVQQRAGVQLSGGVGNTGDEHEQHADAVADKVVRGESAESLLDQYGSAAAGAGHAVQRKFVKLDEARIQQVVSHAKQSGEDLDPEYLEGLWEKQSDHGNPNPPLFMQVAKVMKSYLYPDSGGFEMVRVFAHVDAPDAAEAEAARNPGGPNALQIMAQSMKLFDLNENELPSAAKIAEAIAKQTGARSVDESGPALHHLNDIVGNAAAGGIAEDSALGGYGNIEFRFKAGEGELYVAKPAVSAFSGLASKHPAIAIIPTDPTEIARFRHVYQAANLPYPAERAGDHFVFIEAEQSHAFRAALDQSVSPAGIQAHGSQVTATRPADARPAPPIAVPKRRQRIYEFRSGRGSRDAGQKAAMANVSAKEYVAQFNSGIANQHSWEWLHIQGSRLGGPNRAENLVAGTEEANTQMIPYERAIYNLSEVATREKPVKVTWEATVKPDHEGMSTHIADEIGIAVEFPQGAPDKKADHDPQALASIFPVRVNGLQGASFTKLDRDIVDKRKQP